jgi:N-acetylglucosamine-6-phosphate deacetylase
MLTHRLGVAAALVDGSVLAGDVSVADGRIQEVGLSGAGAGLACPGFIDLQVNGFAGVDLLTDDDDDAWRHVGERLLAVGVTAYQPTLITAPPSAVRTALKRAARLMRAGVDGAQILGVHLEGPFISSERLGTHPAEHRRDPDAELLRSFLSEGSISMVTLAPELDGAGTLIDILTAGKVAVSAGHSAAPADVAHRAFDRGVRALTHIFNAMPPIAARDPGLAGVALSRQDVVVLCILDGVHLATETARLVLSVAGERVALISDAIAAAGAEEGSYQLGTVTVRVRDGRATCEDGALAGGIGTIADCLRAALRLGVSPEAALSAATAIPGRLLARDDIGILRPGSPADVVVVDDSLVVTQVLRAGTPVELAVP